MGYRASQDDAFHEDVEKDCDGETDAAHNHTRFDLVITLYFRRDSHLPLYFLLAPRSFLARHEHVCYPGVTPIKLLTLVSRINCLPYGLEIRSTRLTEVQVITWDRTASGTKHKLLLFWFFSAIRNSKA
jgi:hypothetical protein